MSAKTTVIYYWSDNSSIKSSKFCLNLFIRIIFTKFPRRQNTLLLFYYFNISKSRQATWNVWLTNCFCLLLRHFQTCIHSNWINIWICMEMNNLISQWWDFVDSEFLNLTCISILLFFVYMQLIKLAWVIASFSLAIESKQSSMNSLEIALFL